MADVVTGRVDVLQARAAAVGVPAGNTALAAGVVGGVRTQEQRQVLAALSRRDPCSAAGCTRTTCPAPLARRVPLGG